ncbi:2-keto-4-pentenoate hydratase/2-oxohepta-3-ene-1,7-dioic acid hydratase in catechol pathway [Conyzicola lurida]|uniref:2-keto-4-pentenoate hydratase/2-oxohepta-3-ene-1,7-dioic acid hydratase in catechol pathway n=1 Tax=Conyzicola lurida TaxID=1172621 RepID=A0A841AQN6_9MICO|nr:2-keto-4-pentenoate hydratase/2-oxohepta-3-ene-1,7-dioic acid hydratase in catechol pathway [Conyzicola lurida]
MKIARFSSGGDPRFGIVDGDELVVLTGDPMFVGFDTTEERVPLSDVRLLAPVIPRSKVLSVEGNYPADPDEDTDAAPLIFLKPNTTVVGPGDPILLPDGVGAVAHEGELVVVIGRIAKKVSVENALDHVFGYTVGNDVTAVDLMAEPGQESRAKGYDTFAPVGPVIETELDPQNLTITTRVDGETRLSGSTGDSKNTVAELVAFASDIFTLLPGDIIMTGSPAGDGAITAGQFVEIGIGGIGTLGNPTRARA